MRKHDKECEMKDGYLSCDCPRIGPKPETKSIQQRLEERSEATTSAASYTPGPWKVQCIKKSILDLEDWAIDIRGQKMVGRFMMGNAKEIDEVEANARLIAAAPELLEALKILVESETVDRRDYKFAEHVINKAEGR